MRDEVIQFKDILEVIKRNLWLSIILVVLCSSAAIGASFLVKKSYKAKAVLSIQNAYFQLPLVDDFIAPVHDPGEMRSQREALLRYALNEKFVDELAGKYGAYKTAADHPMRTVEREIFMKRIQFVSTAPTTFQITVSGGTPAAAREMTQAVLDQMISTLISQRLNQLYRAKNAVQSNIETLRFTLSGSKNGSPANAGVLEELLRRSEEELAVLEKRFAAQHPSVIRHRLRTRHLRNQLEALENKMDLESQKEERKADETGSASAAMGSRKALEELYDDLVKKFNYVNIALEMEKDPDTVPYLNVIEYPSLPASPFFPKKKVFLMIGFAGGFMLAVLLAVFRELRRGSFLSPLVASSTLGVPLLGTLPERGKQKE